MNKFSELGVSAPLLKSLEELGFEAPTTIQQKALPILYQANTDFIGLAHTGTGKTAAFGLPLLSIVQPDAPAIQALILAPTRELCQQIAVQIKQYGKYQKEVNIQTVYGGAPIQKQIKDLRRVPQILTATPGRLIDLLGRKALKLNQVRYLVLDEADEMLNMGFQESIDKILAKTPTDKYTWLFSATMSKDIRAIVDTYMKNPQEIRIEGGISINQNISHQYISTKRDQKLDLLKSLLDAHEEMSGVIFCRTKRDTQELADELNDAGYAIDAIHGDLTQKQRDWVMKRFKERKLKLITATDVVARGIDVKDLSHVIHYNLPDDLEYYTHRSGRTARAGKEGVSIALITKGEERRIREIEGKLKIKFQRVDEFFNPVETSEKEKAERRRERPERRNERPERRNERSERRNERPVRERAERRSPERSESRKPERAGNGRPERVGPSGFNFNQTRPAPGMRKRIGAPAKEYSGEKDASGQRFFINIGKVDSVSKSELLSFVVRQTKVAHDHVQKIEMFDKHSFFEIKHNMPSKITACFKGISIDGRALRVNEDKWER